MSIASLISLFILQKDVQPKFYPFLIFFLLSLLFILFFSLYPFFPSFSLPPSLSLSLSHLLLGSRNRKVLRYMYK